HPGRRVDDPLPHLLPLRDQARDDRHGHVLRRLPGQQRGHPDRARHRGRRRGTGALALMRRHCARLAGILVLGAAAVLLPDARPTQGQFSYGVGLQTAAAVPDGDVGGGSGIGLGYGIARWAAFVGLALAMGTTVVSALGRPGPAAAGALRRLFTVGWVTLVL